MHRAFLCLALASAGLLAASTSQAGPKGETYYFDVVDVVAKADDVPESVVEQTREAIAAEIKRLPQLRGDLPEAAPDPKASPKKFQRWLLRRNMRAFKVTVEISEFEQTVETPEDRDQRLKVHVALHMFGETLPQRSFGFTGDGSATIAIEVGSKVRDKDETVARADALELASQKAIAESVTQLRAASKGKKKKPSGKKTRKKSTEIGPRGSH